MRERIADAAEGDGAVEVGSARSVLLTLFGEYVHPPGAPCWTAPLLRALAAAGIAEKAARQALMRAAAAGWLDGERAGRRTVWRLTGAGRTLIADGSRRVASLRRAREMAWDGRWLLAHVTLPETRRADRLRLYRALAWIGLGSPTPAIWLTPHADRAEELRGVVAGMDLAAHALAFEARALGFGVPQEEVVRQAWDLDAIAAHYDRLLRHFRAARPRSGAETFLAHLRIVNALQRLPAVDPGLPRSLLPVTWTGRRPYAQLAAMRDAWRDAAHREWGRMTLEEDD